MRQKQTRINDVFPYWLNSGSEYISGGFFANLQTWAATNNVEIPFLPDAETARKIDYAYHGNFSGRKIISPLIENLIEPSGKLTTATVNMLVSMFWALHGENCRRQYAVLSLEYNPIENYSMTESGTDERTGYDEVKHTGADTLRNSGTDTTSNTGTDTTSKTGTDSVENSGDDTTIIDGNQTAQVAAFDSAGFENSDKQITDDETKISYGHKAETEYNTEIETEHNTQTETTHGHIQTQERGTNDKTEYNSSTEHEFSRAGNIGVTTSQQMIESEIALWQWNFYHNFLFPVVDMVCTIPIY